MCWGVYVHVCTEYSTQYSTAPDAILQSALFTWATRIQIAQCLVHVGGTDGQADTQVQSPAQKVWVLW